MSAPTSTSCPPSQRDDSWSGRAFFRASLIAGVLALATTVSIVFWATSQRDPSAAAEGRFLAVVACAVLLAVLPISWLTGRPSLNLTPWLLVLGFPVACLAGVVLAPSGPDRGAVLGLILASAIATAAAGVAAAGPSAPLLTREISLFALLAFGSQALLRPDEWLALVGEPTLGFATALRLAMQLFLWPVLFGCVLGLLAHGCGRARALFLLAATALCVGKISLTVVAVAFVITASRRAADASLKPALVAGAARVATGLPALALFGVALVILFLQSAVLATIALLACLGVVATPTPSPERTLARDVPGEKPTRRFWPALLLVMAGVLSQLSGSFDPGQAGAGPVERAGTVLVLLVPLVVAEFLLSRRRATGLDRWAILVALVLAILGSRLLDPAAAILVPALILAIGTARKASRAARLGSGRLGAAEILIAALLIFGLAGSAYPWLRPLPAAELPELAGALVGSSVERQRRNTLIRWPAVTLDVDSPTIEFACPDPKHPPSHLVLDAALANGTDLEPGSIVATLQLRQASGRVSAVELRAGNDVAEWSARRRDFGDRLAPDPWLAFTSASGEFFGQRYRSRIDFEHAPGKESGMPPSSSACSISIHVAEQLPPTVLLTVFHLTAVSSR